MRLEVVLAAENGENNVIRPRSGLPRFKRNAKVEISGSVITASNRWGKSRAFPLSGAENSPERAGNCFGPGGNLWWLEDSNGKVLLVIDMDDWAPKDFLPLEKEAGFGYRPASHALPPVRSDVFKVNDLPTLQWGSGCVAIGVAAMSGYWLHILPELVVMAVALPALAATLWCLALLWMARPDAQERAEIANLMAHLDETSDRALAIVDEAVAAEQKVDGAGTSASPADAAEATDGP